MQPGEVIADRFELVRHAGSGGAGEIWQARDRALNGMVALKLLTIAARDDFGGFTQEAMLLAGLTHPGIVRYVGHGMTPSRRPYLVMEWLEGEDLSQRLERGRLGVDETVALLEHVSDALCAAHGRGVIHRDIKPNNLFLPDGAIERVKVIDFGVARTAQAAPGARTRGATVLGTPAYMAPEQARGDPDIDAGADLFALGCVAYECLAGRRAFEADHAMGVFAKILLDDVQSIRELRADVPTDLEELVTHMLAKDRAERPRDAGQLVKRLAALRERRSEGTTQPAALLTQSEQRILGIVLAPPLGSQPAPPASVSRAEESLAQEWSGLKAAAGQHDAQLERLADGSVLAVLARTGGASDLAAQAARCALAMREVVRGRPLALAMGRGEVDAGLTAEVVDRAARLLVPDGEPPSEATPGIVLDDVTAGLLDARFELSRAGSRLELRTVRALDESPRTLLGRVTPCLGREREIAALDAIVAESSAERVARAVLVTAAAGMGKSRLRNEVVNRVRRRSLDGPTDGAPVEVWMGRGDPMKSGSAFGLAAQMLRQACGIAEADSIELQQQQLRACVARHRGLDPQRVTAFLGELIGAPFGDEHDTQLRAARQDAVLLGDQMRRAYEDFVRAQTETAPVLMILEDLHWGDPPSVKLMDALLRNLRQQPLTVLALARPEVHDRFPRLWAERELQEVRLAPLTRKAAVRLVRETLPSTVSDEMVLRIVERAGGNAFYLEELIRTVAEGRGDRLPDTILATVQTRLERLDAGARRVLRAASVFGQTFWKDGASELLGGARGLNEWLVHLCEQEIVSKGSTPRFADEEEYVFHHALLREGAYAMLTHQDRALGHVVAGSWLEQRGERDAMVLAEHFELGGSRERALRFFPRAAEQALEGNDLEGVLARVGRAVACGAVGRDLGALRSLQAEAHDWRGEDVEGEGCATEAVALLEPGTAAWYNAAREGIITAAKLGRTERVHAIVASMRLASAASDATSARRMALAWGAFYITLAGGHPEAEEILQELGSPAGAPAMTEPRAEAVVTQSRGVLALVQQKPEALDLLEAALAGFVAAGDLRNASNTRQTVALAYSELGAFEEAEALLRHALGEAERLGLHTTIPEVKVNLACALMGLGRADEARVALLAAAQDFARQGHPFAEGIARGYLCTLLLECGELQEAEAAARQACSLLGEAPQKAFALAGLAFTLLRGGRPDEGLLAAEEAMQLLREHGRIEMGESLVRLAFVEALHAAGDARAREALSEAVSALELRAAGIADPARRRTFMERIPENFRTYALAREWSLEI